MHVDAQVTRLPGGLRVATVRMPSVDSVAMGFWVGIGGRHEPARLNGISHYIEHLLFKGTTTRSARDISEEIEGHGGYFDAYTQEEHTCYYARVAAKRTWDVFDVLSDMFLHPRFAAADVEKERQVILEEIAMYREQPAQHVDEMMMAALWPGHALGRPLTGTKESLQNLHRKELLAFKKSFYSTRRTVVGFAGRIEHAEAVERVRETLASISGQKAARINSAAIPRKPRAMHVEKRETDQVHLALGFRCFGRHDPRRHAARLLSVMMGELMSSRLFQRVREDHGLAYAINSGVQLYEEAGFFAIDAGLDRTRSGKALALIVSELQRACARPPSRSELQRAKDYTTGQMLIGLENSANQLSFVGEQLLAYGHVQQPSRIIEQVETVTPEDIRIVARAIFRRSAASCAVILPSEDRHTEGAVRSALNRL